MKRINKEGPALLGQFHEPARLDAAMLPALLARKALVVDTRTAAEYAAGHLPGTINIPLNASFVTWAGWLIPADEFYLIVDAATAEARLGELARSLAMIGFDRITGYFDAAAAGGPSTVAQISTRELSERLPGVTVVDVRSETEWASGHIRGAVHVPLGYLADRAATLPREQPIVVQCQSGARSAIAASVLERLGFANVMNLPGGMSAWVADGLPVEEGTHEQQATRA
jgi:hydroxyacylglutathione hydrolase